jgi:hypothetical protein
MKAKAVFQAQGERRISIALGEGEQAIIGNRRAISGEGPGTPAYDLSEILPADHLEGVAGEHALLTFQDGDFWVKTLDENETRIGPIEVVPGHLFRLVHGDTIRFGGAELSFLVQELGADPSPVARASAEN